jgi:hypothetical protein
MAGIWDIPLPPQIGDASEDITFASVGRALTRWEEFETIFASLFASLVGTHDNNTAAVRAYGSVITFRGRADMVRAAAEVHFHLYPDSEVEKKFDSFINELTNHACARRNEIAHGIVKMEPRGSERHFYLSPPHYAANKNRLAAINTTEAGHQMAWYNAKYFYTSIEINRFAKAFQGLVPRLLEIMAPMMFRRAQILKLPSPPT